MALQIPDSNSISSFINNPNQYLLQIKTVNGNQQLRAIKKGLWTWIKIHIGSHLGLFDKNSIKFSNIANSILAKENIPGLPNENAFYDAFDYKIVKWNSRHSRFDGLATKNPHQLSFEINCQSPSTFHNWLLKRDTEVSAEVIKKIPNGCFSNVKTLELPEARNKLHCIKLTPYGDIRYKGFPNLKKIVSYFNGEIIAQDGVSELKKVASLGKNLLVYFSTPNNEPQGQCRIQIVLENREKKI